MSLLKGAFGLLEELEATTKRNEKLEILSKGKGNEVFTTLLELAYNPFKMYNIVSYGDVTPVEGKEPSSLSYTRFCNLLQFLTERVLTGNEAISTVTTFFNSLSEQEYKWYSRVLKKDLRAGITGKSINKVFPKLIPEFQCMLAKAWKDIKKKPKFVIVDTKFDGYRDLSFVKKGESVELFSRNGKPILGFKDVEEDLKKLPTGIVYDSEIVGKENQFNDMQKLVFNKKVEVKEGTLLIFDALPIEEFEKGKSTKTLKERKEFIYKLQEMYSDLEHIKFIPGSQIFDTEKDWDKILEIYESMLTEGYEGVMIKDIDGLYETKKSSSWLKLKPSETADLEIIGSVEGEGKFKGVLGALVVDWKGYPVEVGSGLSDEVREDLWARRNEIVGKIIEVEYDSETTNQKGTKSLRFPRLVQFREDKTF